MQFIKIIFIAVFSLLTISACKEKRSKQPIVKEEETPTTIEKAQFGGLALYTVREAMKEDVKATLKTVAQVGYKNIEAAGYKEGKYYNMNPEDFKALLQELHLTPISTHQSSVTLDNAEKEMADAKAAGFQYFVVPVPPMGLFNFDRETMQMSMTGGAENLANILNELGKKADVVGLKLLYHNHDFEFIKNSEGIVPIDYLLENCDPKYVNFQMDLFWATPAGTDPIAYFEKYPGRFKI